MIAVYVLCCLLTLVFVLILSIHTPPSDKAFIITGLGATDRNGVPRVVIGRSVLVIPIIQRISILDIGLRSSDFISDEFELVDGATATITWSITYSPIPELIPVAARNFANLYPDEVCEIMVDLVYDILGSVITPLDAAGLGRGINDVRKRMGNRIAEHSRETGMKIELYMHKIKIVSR